MSDPEDAAPDEAELEPPEDAQLLPARARSATLSIVATPIGNLEDITLRALRTLREADVVLAEDTRRTRVLCLHHGIHCQLRSFHAHSSAQAQERVLEELAAGKHVALVTDAGTPLLSDPGAALVSAARARGLAVEAIPGPSAITAALTVAGLAVDQFRFVGFLPRSGRRRREALARVAQDPATSVLFESPRRLPETLEELAAVLQPDQPIAVCRELTKLHEEVARGSARELLERFRDGARGEITLVIEGRGPDAARARADSAQPDLDARIEALLADGMSARDAATRLAQETGQRRQEIYARIEAIKAGKRVPAPED